MDPRQSLSPQASGGGEEWGHTYTLDNVECVGVTPCRVLIDKVFG